MTRMIRGSVLLAACLGLWSCSSDPTADQAGVPFKVVALPSIVFIKQDSSQLISFQLVDELDGQIPESWTLTSTSPYFTVALDSSYRPVYNSDGTLTLPDQQTQVRATLTGKELGPSSFTASAGGKSLTITVNVVPGTLHAVFTPANPAPGEVVTITMPPSLRFTPLSKLGFPGNQQSTPDTSSIRNLVIAADSMSATFISSPTVDTTARVTLVYNTDFPTISPVTLNSETKVTGTLSGLWTGELPATISNLTPGVPPITVTLDAPFAFKIAPDSSVFTFPNQVSPILNSLSADSSSATISVAPNIASPVRATKVTFRGAPQFEYALVSADSVISTDVIPGLPATLSPATNVQVGDTVTITITDPNFTLDSKATVSWPLGSVALVTGTTAGSIGTLPMPKSSGIPTVTGVIAAVNPQFKIPLPAIVPTTLTMLNTSIYGGKGNPATATTLTVPPIGTDTLEFYDISSNVDQFYRLTFAANATLAFTLTWPAGPDLDMLFCNLACSAYAPTPAVFSGATGANPENATVNYTVAGGPSYNLWVNLYAGLAPAWIKIRVRRTS